MQEGEGMRQAKLNLIRRALRKLHMLAEQTRLCIIKFVNARQNDLINRRVAFNLAFASANNERLYYSTNCMNKSHFVS